MPRIVRGILPLSLLAVLALAAAAGPARAESSYRVIVNSASGVSALSAADVSAYFLKTKTKWESGAKVLPVDLADDAKAREDFSEGILRRSVAAVKAYWQQQIFSGRALPPPELKDDAAVTAYVKANEGAIGYVSSSADVADVKVLEIRGKK